MLTTIFTVMLVVLIFKLIVAAIKAAWTITKVIGFIVFLPIILVGMALGGLIKLALILIVISFVISLFS